MISFLKYNGRFKVNLIKRYITVSRKNHSDKIIRPFLCDFLLNRINLEVLEYPELSDKNQLLSILSVSKKFKEIISNFEDEPNFTGLSGKMSKEGFLSINIPEGCGGVGFNKMQFMQMAENMFYNMPFSFSTLIQQFLVLEAFVASNSEIVKKYLDKLNCGELHALYCVNEHFGKELVPKNFKTQATLSADGKYYCINGRKTKIINADASKLLLVIANVENPNQPEISKPAAFVVDPHSDGLNFIPESDNKFSLPGMKYYDIVFSDVRVPLENKLIDGTIANQVITNLFTMENAFISEMSVGLLKSVMREYYDFISTREVFGVPLSSYQRLKCDIMIISKDILLNESISYYIAGILDQYPNADFSLESAITKTICIEVLSRWVEKYLILLGHSGRNKNNFSLRLKEKCKYLQFHEVSCLNTHMITGHKFIQYVLDDNEDIPNDVYTKFLIKLGFVHDVKCTNIDGTKSLRLSNYFHPEFMYYITQILILLRELSVTLYSLKKEHGHLLLEDEFLKYQLSEIMFDFWLFIVGSSKVTRTRCLYLPTAIHEMHLFNYNSKFAEIKLQNAINNLKKYSKETYPSKLKKSDNLSSDKMDKILHPFNI